MPIDTTIPKKSPLIEVKKLTFTYDSHPILDDVQFNVTEGDYLGIIGPNGSGKTTLLKLILGLLPVQKGQVKLNTEQPIGYVPQRVVETDRYFPATVTEVVATGRVAQAGLFRFFDSSDGEAINQAMAITKVSQFKDRLVGSLSGGERQRVFIARALASQPKILILDEPTVGVDSASEQSFYTLLCDLNKHHNVTIILVSHDIDVIAQEVKTILFLNHKVIAHGLPRDLMKEKVLEKLYGQNVKLIVHQH